MTRADDHAARLFAALGDPTRLSVLDAVASEGPVTATRIAQRLPITRQAVAKHLAVLHDAGLVTRARAGREARYEASPDGLDGAARWIADQSTRWDRRLARLGARARGSRVGNDGAPT